MLLNGEEVETTPSATPTTPQKTSTAQRTESNVETEEKATDLRSGQHSYRLEELAYLRSGDKGNTANIGTGEIVLYYYNIDVGPTNFLYTKSSFGVTVPPYSGKLLREKTFADR